MSIRLRTVPPNRRKPLSEPKISKKRTGNSRFRAERNSGSQAKETTLRALHSQSSLQRAHMKKEGQILA